MRLAPTVSFLIMSSTIFFAMIWAVAHASGMIISIPTSIPITVITILASTATSPSVIPILVLVPIAISIPEKYLVRHHKQWNYNITMSHLQALRWNQFARWWHLLVNVHLKPKSSTIQTKCKPKSGEDPHLGRGLRLLDLPLIFEDDSTILPLRLKI